MTEVPFKYMVSHPLADPFPLLTSAEAKKFAADIKANGLIHPIVIYHGAILDGRNRFNALKTLRRPLDPSLFVEFVGDWDEAMTYVLSINNYRRHLETGMRADCASAVAQVPRPGRSRPTQNCVTPDTGEPEKKGKPISQAKAAEMFGVSPRSVQHARTVQDQGVPELREAVRNDEIKVHTAAKLAKLPPEEQRAALVAGSKEARKRVTPPKTRAQQTNEQKLEKLVEALILLADSIVEGGVDSIVDRPAMLDGCTGIRRAAERIEAVASITDAGFDKLLEPKE